MCLKAFSPAHLHDMNTPKTLQNVNFTERMLKQMKSCRNTTIHLATIHYANYGNGFFNDKKTKPEDRMKISSVFHKSGIKENMKLLKQMYLF